MNISKIVARYPNEPHPGRKIPKECPVFYPPITSTSKEPSQYDSENMLPSMDMFEKKTSTFKIPSSLLPMSLAVLLIYLISDDGSTEVTWNEFKNKFLTSKNLDSLHINIPSDRVRINLKSQSRKPKVQPTDPLTRPYHMTVGNIESLQDQLDEAQDELEIPIKDRIFLEFSHASSLPSFVMELMPLFLVGAFLVPPIFRAWVKYTIPTGISWVDLLPGRISSKRVQDAFRKHIKDRQSKQPGNEGGMGGMGGMGGGGIRDMFSFSKSKHQKVDPSDIKVGFADVAGCDQAKNEVMEFVDYLKAPEKYERLGAKVPRGLLLTGPPGTGKTLLAKATAGEANVTFFSTSGSEFQEVFVGVGSARIRDLFKEARKSGKPCIIFIDELDAIGQKRASKSSRGGNDERESTLNQLLVEMDGFENDSAEGSKVIVMAATNRSSTLDDALLRPGRFDRIIDVPNPDTKARRDIMKIHLKPLKLGPIITESQKLLSEKSEKIEYLSSKLATLTPGFSGAQLKNVCNEAAMIAARRGDSSIQMIHFEQALDRVIAGIEKPDRIVPPTERRVVAYHEAGHALVGWMVEHTDPLLKVSIVPRGPSALGYAQYLPKETNLTTREEFLDLMCKLLGGRVAEDLKFKGRITTGASDDLEKVTQIAYSLITVYGMSSSLGPISWDTDNSQFQTELPYSEATARIVDAEARSIVQESYLKTKKILEDHSDQLDQLAEQLLDKEILVYEDLVKVLGIPPHGTHPTVQHLVAEYFPDSASNVIASTKDSPNDTKEIPDTNEKGKLQPPPPEPLSM